MRCWLLVFVGLLPVLAWAETPLRWGDTLRLADLPGGRMTVGNPAHWQQTPPGYRNLTALSQLPKPTNPATLPTGANFAYWFRCQFQNTSNSVQQVYLYGSNNPVVTAYFIDPSVTVIDSLRCGTMVPRHKWAYAANEQYIPIQVAPRQTRHLLIRVANEPGVWSRLTTTNLPRLSLNLRFETETYHAQWLLKQYRQNLPELQYRSWVQGGLLLFLLFIGLVLAYYRQAIYGYYALYVLAGCVYALLKTRTYTPVGQLIAEMPLLRYHALEGVLWAGWGGYVFFLIELLNLSQTHPIIARRMRQWAWFAITYSLLTNTLLWLTNDGGLYQYVYWISRLIFISLHLYILVWLVMRVASVLTRYVVIGNVLMITIGLLASLRASELILTDGPLPGYIDNLLMMPLAVLLEIIVFGMALAHRMTLIDRDREASRRAYLDEIAQRTAYEKRLAEVEMLALRSQMNPHFLFNSLNTIEYFVLKGDEEKASRYLSSFSRLLRLILNHSNEETVRLSEELAGLRLYLELEATRFGDEFQYSLDTDPAIGQDEVLLPPLLLQPFVENAIWHGLRQSQRPDKRLWIRIVMQDAQTLRFEIEDNGIGRQQAAELKSRSATPRKSYGVAITQQRIDLFNRNYPSQLDAQLLDLQNDNQTGTLVLITYRLALSPAALYERNTN